MRKSLLLLTVAALGSGAADPSGDGGGSPGSATSAMCPAPVVCADAGACPACPTCFVPTPEELCLQFADIYADKGASCGIDFNMFHGKVISSITGAAANGCAAIVKVVDPAAFVSTCFPSLRALTCAQINDPNLKLNSACVQLVLP